MKKNKLYKVSIVVLHLIGWMLLLLLPLLTGPPATSLHFVISAIHVALLAIFFYFNMFYLIPNYLSSKRLFNYISLCVLSIVIVSTLIISVRQLMKGDDYFKPGFRPPPMEEFRGHRMKHDRNGFGKDIIPSLISVLFIFALSTSFKTISEYLNTEKKQNQSEKEKLNSELSFLKSQVSPHFLFNTLNNIYSLASIKSDDTAPTIMKLSDMLRYMLYESEKEKVAIMKEVEYLKSYMELQKLRLPEDVRIDFNVQLDNGQLMIAPMLLIPFIENAFKHGISYSVPSFIEITIRSIKESIILTVKNTVNSNKDKDENSGIGLQNVRRRLELLYSGKHSLKLKTGDALFEINLTLDLL